MFGLLSPGVAYASVDSFLMDLNREIVNPLIGLLFALAVIYFLYGVFQFIANQDNEEHKLSGKRHMVWGVVGIAIMLGVFGILQVMLNTLNIPQSEINPKEGKVDLKKYTPPSE